MSLRTFFSLTAALSLILVSACNAPNHTERTADTETNNVATNTIETNTPPKQNVTRAPFEGHVEHLFVHALIAEPEKAFDGDKNAERIATWHITAGEYRRALEGLYENGYILIDFSLCYERVTTNGGERFVKRTPRLPKGKRPFVLSIDTMHYYPFQKQNGFIDRLTFDTNGTLAAVLHDEEGRETYHYDKDFVSITEAFIASHPDFSFEGARGIIAQTGYGGNFGYPTHKRNASNYSEVCEHVRALGAYIKARGWKFASHSYWHFDATRISYEKLAVDTTRWNEEVETFFGETDTYIYPFGTTLQRESEKLAYLIDEGFTIFHGVGRRPYFRVYPTHVIVDRIPIDGNCLIGKYGDVSRFFDIERVVDERRFHMNDE